jgi:hypothetical protein
MIGGLGTWFGALVVLFGAIRGIKNYREQKRIDREFDAAEQILTAAYRARDALDGIRPRIVEGSELAKAESDLREANADFDVLSKAEQQQYIQRRVLYRRAEFFKDDFNAVFTAMPLARIFFGETVESNLKELARARQRLFSAVDILPVVGEGNTEDDRKFSRDLRRAIYGSKDEEGNPDEVTKISESAIQMLEEELIPRVRQQGKIAA